MNGPVLIGLVAATGILGLIYAVTDHASPLPRIAFVIAGAIGVIALDLPWMVTALIFAAIPSGWIAMRILDRWAISGAPWEDIEQPSKPGLGKDWKARFGGDAASNNWRRGPHGDTESEYSTDAGPGRRRSGAPSMDRDRALAALGLGGSASDADIKRAHRRLMKTHHPDRGGSTDMAARLNQARGYLLGE